MDKPFFVYRHIRLDTNQPFYVGIGKKPKKYNGRNTEYKRAYNTSHRNSYWKNIVNKTDYKIEILWESENLEEVQLKEIEFISLYGRKEDGGTLANMTSGGEFTFQDVYKYRKNFKHSEETKRKISKTKKGKRSSEETKKLLSQLHKDKNSVGRLQGLEEKAKESRREGLPRVTDKLTNKEYRSLPDACEQLGLDLVSERRKLYRKSTKNRFKYINPEILERYKRNK